MHKPSLRFARLARFSPPTVPGRISPLAPFGGVSTREVREIILWHREHERAMAGGPESFRRAKGGGA